LLIVDEAYEWLFLCGVGQKAQNGESDQEAIRRRAIAHPEGSAKCVALWDWKPFDAGEHWSAELV
jgi:hypothetical protein